MILEEHLCMILASKQDLDYDIYLLQRGLYVQLYLGMSCQALD
jgi:hypothetical protein